MLTLARRLAERKPCQPAIDPVWLNHCDATCLTHYMSCVRGYDWSAIYSDPAEPSELRGYQLWIDALWQAEESDPGPDPLPYPRETYVGHDPLSNILIPIIATV